MRRTCARVKLLSVVASCTALHRLSVRAAGLLPVRVSHTLPCVVASCTALHRLGVRAAGVFCAPTTTPVSAGSLSVCQSRVLSKSRSRAGKSRVTCRSRLIISRLSSLCVYAFTTSPFTLCSPVGAPVGAGRFLLAGNRWQFSCAVECGLYAIDGGPAETGVHLAVAAQHGPCVSPPPALCRFAAACLDPCPSPTLRVPALGANTDRVRLAGML